MNKEDYDKWALEHIWSRSDVPSWAKYARLDCDSGWPKWQWMSCDRQPFDDCMCLMYKVGKTITEDIVYRWFKGPLQWEQPMLASACPVSAANSLTKRPKVAEPRFDIKRVVNFDSGAVIEGIIIEHDGFQVEMTVGDVKVKKYFDIKDGVIIEVQT